LWSLRACWRLDTRIALAARTRMTKTLGAIVLLTHIVSNNFELLKFEMAHTECASVFGLSRDQRRRKQIFTTLKIILKKDLAFCSLKNWP
jgi:hypothetical protein